MATYKLTATVTRVIIDNIDLEVESNSFKQAYNKAYLVLEQFPGEHKIKGVSKVLVVDRKYHEPNILGIEEQKDVA